MLDRESIHLSRCALLINWMLNFGCLRRKFSARRLKTEHLTMISRGGISSSAQIQPSRTRTALFVSEQRHRLCHATYVCKVCVYGDVAAGGNGGEAACPL